MRRLIFALATTLLLAMSAHTALSAGISSGGGLLPVPTEQPTIHEPSTVIKESSTPAPVGSNGGVLPIQPTFQPTIVTPVPASPTPTGSATLINPNLIDVKVVPTATPSVIIKGSIGSSSNPGKVTSTPTPKASASGSSSSGSSSSSSSSSKATPTPSSSKATASSSPVASPSASASPTSSPEAKKTTPASVICGNLTTIEERVECRLTKDHDEYKKQLNAGTEPYMPEECYPIKDGVKKQACVDRYKSLYSCWSEDFGPDRVSCVKEKLGLPQKLVHIDEHCEDKGSDCRNEYRSKVHNLITFRFYDGEERVEEWYEDGKLGLNDTRDFVVFIAESKIKYYNSSTKAEKIAIIKKVMEEWAKVVEKVKNS